MYIESQFLFVKNIDLACVYKMPAFKDLMHSVNKQFNHMDLKE